MRKDYDEIDDYYDDSRSKMVEIYVWFMERFFFVAGMALMLAFCGYINSL